MAREGFVLLLFASELGALLLEALAKRLVMLVVSAGRVVAAEMLRVVQLIGEVFDLCLARLEEPCRSSVV